MAKQVGPLFITGTIDGIIFYKLNGQYYMRSAGCYKSGKQMRKDPRLKRTMQNAERFGVATKLTKYIYYRQLPPEVRKHGLFGKLTGMVNRWLYKGKSKEEAEALLIAHCQTLLKRSITTAPAKEKPLPVSPETGSPTSLAKTKPLPVPPNRKAKKARYLSHWRVRQNGRLHIPQSRRPGLSCRSDTTPL